MTENFDEKVWLVIGGLMANPKADALTKFVFAAYDPSKDRANNRTVLGGSRFQFITFFNSSHFTLHYASTFLLCNRFLSALTC